MEQTVEKKVGDRNRNYVSVPLRERFWAKVDMAPGQGRDGDCLQWMGTKVPKGYGYIFISRSGPINKQSTHRVSYELHNGPIPTGQVVRHTCDNPSCVNPAHLIIGTHSQNTQDCIARGRHKTNGNDRKTHCPQGHEYTPENTGRNPEGRRCKICFNAYMARYNTKKRAAKAISEKAPSS